MQITACKPKSCERWLNILLQNLTQTGSWTREVHWTRTILSQNILVTNPAKRFVHVFFLHSVYLHKRSSTLIKDWTRLSNTIHRLKLNLFEKPIPINTWSRIFQRYLTVLQIFFFLPLIYLNYWTIWLQTSVWLAGGLKGSKSRLHGNTGHQPSTYVQPQ